MKLIILYMGHQAADKIIKKIAIVVALFILNDTWIEQWEPRWLAATAIVFTQIFLDWIDWIIFAE